MAGYENLQQVAQVLKSNGTDGELVMGFREIAPEDINLKEPVFIVFDGLPVPFYIESFTKRGNTKALVRLTDICSMEDVEEIAGKAVYIEEDNLPEMSLEEDGYAALVGWVVLTPLMPDQVGHDGEDDGHDEENVGHDEEDDGHDDQAGHDGHDDQAGHDGHDDQAGHDGHDDQVGHDGEDDGHDEEDDGHDGEDDGHDGHDDQVGHDEEDDGHDDQAGHDGYDNQVGHDEDVIAGLTGNLCEVGEITDFIDIPNNPCIEVETENGAVMIPLHEDLILSVDPEYQEIIMQIPAGLI